MKLSDMTVRQKLMYIIEGNINDYSEGEIDRNECLGNIQSALNEVNVIGNFKQLTGGSK